EAPIAGAAAVLRAIDVVSSAGTGMLRCRPARFESTRSWRMTSRSSGVAWLSAESQSTLDPSAIDSASAISAAASDLLTGHFLGQPEQRAADRHARGVG